MQPIIVEIHEIRNPNKGPKLTIFKVMKTESGSIGKIDSRMINRIPAIGPIPVMISVECATKVSTISFISSPFIIIVQKGKY